MVFVPLALGVACGPTDERSVDPESHAEQLASLRESIDNKEYDRAAASAEAALEKLTATGASRSVAAAEITDVLVEAKMGGRLAPPSEVREHAVEAVEIKSEVLAPDDPSHAISLANLGKIDISLGRYDDARPSLERALEIAEVAFGEDDVRVAPHDTLKLHNR